MQVYNILKIYYLEITVFICGAVVMILELVGSRILAPEVGTTIIVWTNLLGVILSFLSIGYYIGGRYADAKFKEMLLYKVILIAAIFIALSSYFHTFILSFLSSRLNDVGIISIIASIILFAPANLFLGMVTPFAVKIRMMNLKKTGTTVGKLYAISTIGGILGTFTAGFVLIPNIGSKFILYFISSILILISINGYKKQKLLIILIFGWIIVSFLFARREFLLKEESGIMDFDTRYSHVSIFNKTLPNNQRKIKVMKINSELSSVSYVDSNELFFLYTRYYRLAKYFNNNISKGLMIGGGGYSYAMDFLSEYPNASLDVVEIDPVITQLAKKYFKLENNQRLNIFHEDGRTFINKNTTRYDVIFIDVFNDFSIPFHLTTKEAVHKMFNFLNDSGLVLLNIKGATDGEMNKFLRAEYKTYQEVFPQIYLIPTEDNYKGNNIGNYILIASKSRSQIISDIKINDLQIRKYMEYKWPLEDKDSITILTDDYAPVEYYTSYYK